MLNTLPSQLSIAVNRRCNTAPPAGGRGIKDKPTKRPDLRFPGEVFTFRSDLGKRDLELTIDPPGLPAHRPATDRRPEPPVRPADTKPRTLNEGSGCPRCLSAADGVAGALRVLVEEGQLDVKWHAAGERRASLTSYMPGRCGRVSRCLCVSDQLVVTAKARGRTAGMPASIRSLAATVIVQPVSIRSSMSRTGPPG